VRESALGIPVFEESHDCNVKVVLRTTRRMHSKWCYVERGKRKSVQFASNFVSLLVHFVSQSPHRDAPLVRQSERAFVLLLLVLSHRGSGGGISRPQLSCLC